MSQFLVFYGDLTNWNASEPYSELSWYGCGFAEAKKNEIILKWYVVRAISGKEKKVRDYIEHEIKAVGLEDYVKHYAAIRLVNYEKQLSKTIYTASRKTDLSGELFNKVVDSINMAKEIADSLRIMFDFNLKCRKVW